MTTTAEAGLGAAADEQHLEFARSNQRVIVTEDVDFLRLHASGQAHPGIAFCRQQKHSVGQIIRGLELIWELLEPAEMQNHIEFL